MKVLLLSDCHGRTRYVEQALDDHPDAHHVIYCGDGVEKMEELSFLYPEFSFHLVSGNCDFSSMYPIESTVNIDGFIVYFTHGHQLHDQDDLLKQALMHHASVAVCGHTHVAFHDYREGVHLVNPGSIARPRDESRPSYAILDLRSNGILVSIARV